MTGIAPSLEETQAIARLKNGDLDGLEVLITSYQVKAVHAAYLVTGDAEMAQDVVQDAFLHAAEKITQFDESRPFGPWFLKSVINAALKAAKRRGRMVPLDPSQNEGTDAFVNWLTDAGPRPEQMMEIKETQRVVWNALKQLSPEQRAVIILHHYLGMDAEEITNKVHRPTTTVYWWLRTARNRLRELLSPYWQAEHRKREDGNGE